MGDKQEKLEIVVQLENYKLITLIYIYSRMTHITGIPQLRAMSFLEWVGGVVVLCVKKWIDCKELPLRNRHKQVECLQAKIRD